MNKTLKCTIDNDNNISSRKKHKFCFDEHVIVRKKPKHNYFPRVVDSHDKIKKQKKLKLKVKLASVNYSRKKARKEKLKITKALKILEKSLNKKEAFVLKQEKQNFGLKTLLVMLFELIKIFITLWKFIVG